MGITLIQIPYWWDKQKDSLISTIHDQKPDLNLLKDLSQYSPISPLQPQKTGYGTPHRAKIMKRM
jgi:hypothetical protein